MIKTLSVTMLFLVLGCGDRSIDPQSVLETSRKTTAEVERRFEETKKSLETIKPIIDAPSDQADLL